jgi:Ser/Thr protein kinase RdoA (MazF antagonist)
VFDSPAGDSGGSDFGEALPGSDEPDWMWRDDVSKHKSRLLVISTPFLEGRHYAESAAEFGPLVEQLEDLHRDGFVHGDIRGFNAAFRPGGEGRSQFFDWDLGGRGGGREVPPRLRPSA